MSKDKLFVFEFVAGGGLSKDELPISLFCEGFAMLRATIEDFKVLGFEIETLLDERILKLEEILVADKVSLVKKNDDYIKFFKKALLENDYVFIIAPESRNILFDLTKYAEDFKKKLLSVGSYFIEMGSSKFKTYKYFDFKRIKTPKTTLIAADSEGIDERILKSEYSNFEGLVIIKPEDGVGAELIYLIGNDEDLQKFIEIMNNDKEPFVDRPYVIQEYIPGEHFSVSLIGKKIGPDKDLYKPVPISVNAQLLKISGISEPTQYYGGFTPIDDFKTITKIDSLVSALSYINIEGYFGVDFVRYPTNLGVNRHYYIEINPRLTTSYLGIRNSLKQNVMEIVYKAKSESLETVNIEKIGYSHYKRLDFSLEEQINEKQQEGVIVLMKKDISEIITPPISLDGVNYSCFVATKEKSLGESEQRLKKIEKNLI